MSKRMNSMWRKDGPRHDPSLKIPCVKCDTNHTYASFVSAHGREPAGWRNGARTAARKP